jgi:hypothetical protein
MNSACTRMNWNREKRGVSLEKGDTALHKIASGRAYRTSKECKYIKILI